MKLKEFKSGFVALLGRPNVGKSTLVNALVGEKVSIVSAIPQTTRHQIRAILNLDDAQIVFVDTPGIHSFRDTLTNHLNTIAQKSIEGCDVILYVVDVTRKLGKEEERVMRILMQQDLPVIIALNKIDSGRKYLNDYIDFWQAGLKKYAKKDPLLYYIPVSAQQETNVLKVRDAILEALNEGMAFYDKDTTTDFPIKFRIADLVREKLFLKLEKELPHSLAVEVSDIKDKKSVVIVRIIIYINRISQKRIVIGKKGELLKEVGVLARKEIEKIYKKKVYLELWVKVLEDWQQKTRVLKELGYWWL